MLRFRRLLCFLLGLQVVRQTSWNEGRARRLQARASFILRAGGCDENEDGALEGTPLQQRKQDRPAVQLQDATFGLGALKPAAKCVGDKDFTFC